MSKIEELKKQNPTLIIDVVDIIDQLFDKSKYTEMAVNLIKNKTSNQNSHVEEIVNELTREYGFKKEDLKLKSNQEIINIFKVISDYFGYNNFNVMQKQVQKLYETDEWLVIKPLSFLASKKYGSSTKWCTTNEDNPEYYLKYSRRGILIYCINKISGDKVAAFKSLDESYEKETSFWNLIDQRIDSLESGLPNEVMNLIKNEFTNTKQSNWDILSDEEKNKQVLWLENEYYGKKSVEQSRDYELADPMIGEVAVPAPRQARIVPIGLASFDDIPTQAG
jgi:hypothetical protein